MTSTWRSRAGRAVRAALGSVRRPSTQRPVPHRSTAAHHTGSATTALPGPPSGRHLEYSPHLDGAADPGEVVWTWVAYEEDPAQGKDRPVLVVGRQGGSLLALMLSTNHERQGQHDWLALGAGPWDRDGRPSWVRLDRVLVLAEHGIRREGAVLDRARFDTVAAALRRDHGWQ